MIVGLAVGFVGLAVGFLGVATVFATRRGQCTH